MLDKRTTTPLGRALLGGALAAGLVVVSACSGGSVDTQKPPVATSSPAQLDRSNSVTEQAVLAQYSRFWKTLTPAARAAATTRGRMLAAVAADPELSSLLRGIANDLRQGRTFYGFPVVRATVVMVSVARGVALVRDCQDATHTGDAKVSTGELLTRGTAHTLVVSTMHFVAGAWRVAYVTFPRQQC